MCHPGRKWALLPRYAGAVPIINRRPGRPCPGPDPAIGTWPDPAGRSIFVSEASGANGNVEGRPFFAPAGGMGLWRVASGLGGRFRCLLVKAMQ
jgi:hypothetical protein